MVIRRRNPLTNQIEESAQRKVPRLEPVEFISTGAILLNLAASQKGRDGGWARGRINNIVGDGSSGKTLLALEACFWAFNHLKNRKSQIYPEIKDLKIVYNNIEGVMDFPLSKMYGSDFCNAVEWIQSETCEAFGRDYQGRVQSLEKGEALIYVIDSIDATISQAAKDRIEKSIKQDQKEDGNYGTEKAKYFSSSFFNNLCSIMKGKDSTLFCISQTRTKIGITFGKKKYRTGGNSLDFYTHQVVWLYEKKKLKKSFKTQEKPYGIRVIAKWERNKTAIPFREADFIILFDYGLDDVGTMIDYFFGPTGQTIKWKGEEIQRNVFISLVEENEEVYNEIIDLVEKDWKEIEDAIKPKRRKRF